MNAPFAVALVDCGLRRRALRLVFGVWAAVLGGGEWTLAADAPGILTANHLKTLSVEELMELNVTSVSRREEKLRLAPSAIQVISDEDIRRSVATTLPEALRLANNLNVAQKNPHDWAISARGFNANVGNKLLVLIDGRSVYTPLFAGVFWNAQDYVLEDIERAEVISGPGGTLWGANAVNGVINVLTKSARQTQGWYFNGAAGTELEHATNIRYGGAIGPDTHFRVYGKYFGQDDGVITGGARATNQWDHKQGGFRVDAKTGSDDAITVQGDLYSGDLDLQIGGTARMAGGNLLGRWTRRLGDDSELSLQSYNDRTHIAVPFAATPFAPAGVLKDDLDTFDLDFQHSLRPAAAHRLIWGFGYRLQHDVILQQAPNVAYLPPRLDRNLYSLFVQDEFSATNDLVLTAGTKLEHNDYTGLEVEPTVRAQWMFAPQKMVWAAVSRAVRMPSRFDTHLFQPAPPISLIQGNPDFKSETLVAYEAGYRAQFGARISAAASIFYNDYDQLRSWGITPVTVLPIVFQNDLVATAHGAELSVDAQATSWWRVHSGFTLLRENVRTRAGAFDLQNALDETADPRHQFALRSIMDLPGRVELDTAFRWIDALRVNNGGVPGIVPAYAELDVRLAWHVSDALELALVGRNLLHDSHPEFGPPGAAREELQRSLFAKITWRH